MNRIPVKSTNLKSVGWESINDIGVLEVEFQNGEIYRYSDVPEYQYTALYGLNENKGSVGSYFNSYIKTAYRVERVNKTSSPESIVVTPIKIEDDPHRQVLTVEGVPYAYEFFQNFAAPDETKIYKIRRAVEGWITVTDVTLAQDRSS